MKKLHIKNCARCNGDHQDLIFRKLVRPILLTVGDQSTCHSWWGMCPTTNEPIIMEVTWDTLPNVH